MTYAATTQGLIKAIDEMQDAHCGTYPLVETTCSYCLSLDSWLEVLEEQSRREYLQNKALLGV